MTLTFTQPGRPASVCHDRGGHGEPDTRGRCFLCGEPLITLKHMQSTLMITADERRQAITAGCDPGDTSMIARFVLSQRAMWLRLGRQFLGDGHDAGLPTEWDLQQAKP